MDVSHRTYGCVNAQHCMFNLTSYFNFEKPILKYINELFEEYSKDTR